MFSIVLNGKLRFSIAANLHWHQPLKVESISHSGLGKMFCSAAARVSVLIHVLKLLVACFCVYMFFKHLTLHE